MTGPILLLIVCYALLALLVLALCLYTRWSFWVKTSAIVAVTGFYFLTYDALTGILGYATTGRLPERFVYHHSIVVQPDKSTGEKGTIYVWATALTRDGPARQPRAYEIPYDKETSATLAESQRRTREGIVQVGQAVAGPPRQGGGALSAYFSSTRQQQTLRMSDMPAPSLPEK